MAVNIVNINGVPCRLAGGVRETADVIGTGQYSLRGERQIDAVTYRTVVAGIGSGNSSVFTVRTGAQFETFMGTVTAGTPAQLTRDQILESSNSDNAVSWAGQELDLILDAPAALFASLQSSIDTGIATVQSKFFGRYDAATLPRDVTIPANARWIDVGFSNLLFSGAGSLIVQLGNSGVPVSSGYLGYSGTYGLEGATPVAAVFTATNGFPVRMGSANDALYGMMRITHIGSNMWTQMHSAAFEFTSARIVNGGGALQLVGSLNILRIAAIGGQTSDGWLGVTVGF